MKLAVCLLTCGRHDLTRRTVETFMRCNTEVRLPWALLQADEPSMGPESAQIGAAAGFLQVHAPIERGGQMAALRALVAAARALECTDVLWLENDWPSRAPLPWRQIAAGFASVRLYGAWKRLDHEHPRARAGELLLGTTNRVSWYPSVAFPGWEAGRTHWGAGGTVIRLELLERVAGLARVKDAQMALGALHTLRAPYNILHSIGDETTAGFIH